MPSSLHEVVSAIVGAVAGAVTGGITTFCVTRWQYRKQRKDEEIRALEKTVDELVDLAVRYWALEPDDPELPALGYRMNTLSAKVGSLINSAALATGANVASLRIGHIELSRSVSDGQFQVVGRGPEPERHGRIREKGNNLIELAKGL